MEAADESIGHRLSEQSINYFKRVEQVLKENTFDDDEHKETFLRNVFEQVKKEEAQLTRHTLTSRVLEMIIPVLNDEQIECLLRLYYNDLNALCGDRFGSHVIQCLIDHMQHHLQAEAVIAMFCKWCKVLRKDLSNHIRDIYGHHIINASLQLLSGVKIPGAANKAHSESGNKKKKHFNPTARKQISFKDLSATSVPPQFTKQFKKMGKALQEDDNFGELLCHRSGCSVLQTLILVLKCIDEQSYSKLGIFICLKANLFSTDNTECTEEEQLDLRLPVVLTDQMGSHLLETIICAGNETLLDEIYCKCIKKYLLPLSLHEIGNYIVQTYLRSIKIEKQAMEVCHKLLKYVEDILAAGSMGVVIQVAEAIAKFKLLDLEESFINTISQSLHIPDAKKTKAHLVRLLLCLLTFDVLYSSDKDKGTEKVDDSESKESGSSGMLTKELINIHGVNLTKALFSFNNNSCVLKSFLKLTRDELLLLCFHCSGSFCVEAFFQSAEIPLESKDKCFSILKDHVIKLASDKFGSRVLDKVWMHTDKSIQKIISKDLNEAKHVLERNMYGRIILRNCSFGGNLKELFIENDIKKNKKRKVPRVEGEKSALKSEQKSHDVKQEPIEHATCVENVPDVPIPKKKVKKDRAERYREELLKMGITLQTDNKSENHISNDTNSTEIEMSQVSEDLSVILAAVDSSVKSSKKKKV